MQPRADVVVVGAGACGSLAACELTARGASVVVLEAGPRLEPATDLRNSETQRRPDHVERAARPHRPAPDRAEGRRRRGRRHAVLAGRVAAVPSRGLSHARAPRASATTGRSATTTCGRTTRRSSASSASPASAGRSRPSPTRCRCRRIA